MHTTVYNYNARCMKPTDEEDAELLAKIIRSTLSTDNKIFEI